MALNRWTGATGNVPASGKRNLVWPEPNDNATYDNTRRLYANGVKYPSVPPPAGEVPTPPVHWRTHEEAYHY
ncbi:hypothetical protein BDR06DRAFT_962128 [Suillus hirtellus]|nr:hypothetical protein BDR06DRAFT_962128 [Suillus hirtellus]